MSVDMMAAAVELVTKASLPSVSFEQSQPYSHLPV